MREKDDGSQEVRKLSAGRPVVLAVDSCRDLKAVGWMDSRWAVAEQGSSLEDLEVAGRSCSVEAGHLVVQGTAAI